MKRYPDWQNRLHDFIEESRNRKFKRGFFDCALFAGLAIRELTGTDLTKPFLAEYKTYKEAQKLLKQNGFDTLEDVADRHLYVLEIANYAGRGDIVLVEYEGDRALAVVDMSGKNAIMPGLNGLVFFPNKFWLKGWSY